MLFNSYIFIFAFLPATLLLYSASARVHARAAIATLVVASLFYYGWWAPRYVFLILFSILFNYSIGLVLASDTRPERMRRGALVFGVCVNLGLLAYFKYALFIASNVSSLFDIPINLGTITLPLAISFFTFQQIAYLVDARRGLTREYSFIDYCLFVTFFPQLIAGPIVHHGEMLPQFADKRTARPSADNLTVGLSIFAAGLFKKVVLADGVSGTANSVFDAALAGGGVTFLDAWAGALAYTLQLYFDFSGYSDMAIGIGRMFGIRLPVNFDSPYKARSIVDFWRRWHITLSRFLRDYLYIPLGGNRHGRGRRYVNLMLTMLLGGLWHGAAWTFLFWGGLHGLYLVLNHALSAVSAPFRERSGVIGWAYRTGAWGLTFLAVVVGWVFFRAESFGAAWSILGAMFGAQGVSLERVFLGVDAALAIAAASAIAVLAPNTNELFRWVNTPIGWKPREPETLPRVFGWVAWSRTVGWAVIGGAVLAVAIVYVSRANEFLYYQF